MTIGDGGDMRASTRDWLVGPPGWDVGGELRFITSDLGLADGRALKLTDVGLVRARVRYTAARRVELFGSIDALAKQPAYADSAPLQGITAGLKVAVSRAWALSATASGGPTLGDDGQWGTGGTAVVYRSHPDQTLSFQVAGGASATALRMDATPDQWLTELTAGGQIMFHTPNGWWGTWLGASIAVPVAASADLDPNTRLDVSVGSVYAVAPTWDIYLEGSIVDRGDAGMAATMLPILDGGFDQRQLVVGVVRRFDGARDHGRGRRGDPMLVGAR
ncbi:MAG: hypothetical protein IPL61_25515 [Myxococcales bacterium]|nr:hypothetical protein [Myxococcales bacterium]